MLGAGNWLRAIKCTPSGDADGMDILVSEFESERFELVLLQQI